MTEAATEADAMMLMGRGWHAPVSRFAALGLRDLEREVRSPSSSSGSRR